MQKTYTTDTNCPQCTTDIYPELLNHVFQEGGGDFEIECPGCHNILNVTVEAIPSFSLEFDLKKSQKLYKDRLDFQKSIRSDEGPAPRIG